MRNIFFVIGSLLLCAGVVLAQEGCPAMDEAILSVLEGCAEASAGTACYGDGELSIEHDGDDMVFESLGDTVLLSDVMSIDSLSGDGIAQIQLNRDDVPLRLIAYGELSLENSAPRQTIGVYALRSVNLRQVPSVESTVIGSMSQGHDYVAVARLADNTWIQIRLDDGRTGWASAQYFVTQDGFAELEAVTPTTPPYLPMQALTLHTGDCGALLLIAPEIEEEDGISFDVNGVRIEVRGIVLLETAENSLRIISLEGEQVVDTFGFEITLLSEEMTTIQLSESGTIAGIAGEPEASVGHVLDDDTVAMLIGME